MTWQNNIKEEGSFGFTAMHKVAVASGHMIKQKIVADKVWQNEVSYFIIKKGQRVRIK